LSCAHESRLFIDRLSFSSRSLARIRFPGERLPYHYIARTRRAGGVRGKLRTNSSPHENCHCQIRANPRNWRKNSPVVKDKSISNIRCLFRGGGRSRIRTRLHPEFTANRENNREFFEFRLGGRSTRPTSPMFLGLFSRIPYSTEQGIFSTKQGTILHEQGNGGSANREHTDSPTGLIAMSAFEGRADL
jgi:hypothetical protein